MEYTSKYYSLIDNVKRKIAGHGSEISSQKQSSAYMSSMQKLEQRKQHK